MDIITDFNNKYNCKIHIDNGCSENIIADILKGDFKKYLDNALYARYIGLFYDFYLDFY
jgi:hypothetical protein